MEPYTLSALVTVFSCLFTTYLAFNVGMTRMKHKAPPYEVKTPEPVHIALRVQMNMVENMVVFMPLLWIATTMSYSMLAGIIGVIWFTARVWYSYAYLKDPKSRQTPFMLALLCIAALGILSLYGIVFM